MRVIAFYLPQYHPIPENDDWWGAGFTEWTNVAKARPLFAGQHQPQIPADLGFYDLRLPETREAQARLAAEHGVTGFCYYHYWFNGRQLLERPFNDVLQSREPDFPFCLCWANENWTRRWDGRDREVLVTQDYASYDAASHFRWLARAFSDPRYITIEGRPLLMIYRPSDIPDLDRVIDAWHRTAAAMGFPRPFVCAAINGWSRQSPAELLALHCDAVYEFEPNNRDVLVQRTVSNWPDLHVYDYRAIRDAVMARPATEVTVFPCVFPSWDNTARRGAAATVIQNDDPELYAEWLRNSLTRVAHQAPDRQVVFINAWNEWAEGCHLEPDRRMGRAFLRATAAAIGQTEVSHPTGAALTVSMPEPPAISLDVRVDADRALFIWGTGTAARRLNQALFDAGVQVAGFIDNDRASWNTAMCGAPVRSPSDVLVDSEARAAAPFILIASMFADEIAEQLRAAGLQPHKDFLAHAQGLVICRVGTLPPSLRIRSGPAATCNICGGASFHLRRFNQNNHDDAACARCGSSTGDRLLAYLASEEIMLQGQPVMDWPRQKTKVASLDGVRGPLMALDRAVRYEVWKPVSMTMSSGAWEWDLALGTLTDPAMARIGYWDQVFRSISVGGAVLLATDLPGLNGSRVPRPAVLAAAEQHAMQVQSQTRSYPAHQIGCASALIFRKVHP